MADGPPDTLETIMNVQETTEIRELTEDETNILSGGKQECGLHHYYWDVNLPGVTVRFGLEVYTCASAWAVVP
jgi:hypothetical protein